MEVNSEVGFWTAVGIAVIGIYKIAFQVPRDLRENKAESVLIATIKAQDERIKSLETENRQLRSQMRKRHE